MRILRYRTADGGIHIGLTKSGIELDEGGPLLRLPCPSIAEFLAGDLERCRAIVAAAGDPEPGPLEILAPVDGATEVWAAGVTYLRSRDARIEESHQPDVYDRVYAADRPELFFKSVAWRVRGPGEEIAVRADSAVNVPEPELALVLTASGEIAGYTICDDVSSRSIEGDNPLYLPQAKVYNGSCALGPAILASWAAPASFGIALTVTRGAAVVFAGSTSTGQLARPLPDLVRWLYAELDFPAGAVLSTGTGIVPGLDFTLRPGDEVSIEVTGVGTLTNRVAHR